MLVKLTIFFSHQFMVKSTKGISNYLPFADKIYHPFMLSDLFIFIKLVNSNIFFFPYWIGCFYQLLVKSKSFIFTFELKFTNLIFLKPFFFFIQHILFFLPSELVIFANLPSYLRNKSLLRIAGKSSRVWISHFCQIYCLFLIGKKNSAPNAGKI